MPMIPTRRLLVYVVAGLVVLAVGTGGLISMRSDRSGSDSAGLGGGLVLEAGGAARAGAVDAPPYGTGALGEGSAILASSTSTSTTQIAKIWVQVAGAVRRPGVYEVSEGERVFEAVAEAGGFADDADQQAVALAAQLTDGCRVYVPRIGDAAAGQLQIPAASSDGITATGPSHSGGGGGAAAGPVSLNSATLEQLDTLPGIGPSLAQQILSYRESHGPFTSIDQLTDVPGIGAAKLEQLRPLVQL